MQEGPTNCDADVVLDIVGAHAHTYTFVRSPFYCARRCYGGEPRVPSAKSTTPLENMAGVRAPSGGGTNYDAGRGGFLRRAIKTRGTLAYSVTRLYAFPLFLSLPPSRPSDRYRCYFTSIRPPVSHRVLFIRSPPMRKTAYNSRGKSIFYISSPRKFTMRPRHALFLYRERQASR